MRTQSPERSRPGTLPADGSAAALSAWPWWPAADQFRPPRGYGPSSSSPYPGETRASGKAWQGRGGGRRCDLLEIVEDLYDRGSILITSQVPVDRRYDIIGNPTLDDAILDRVVQNAYHIELSGESLRKRRTVLLDA